MTTTMAVANQKGGVGKTTTAVSLSAYLQHARRRVLLVDLDPQANATSGVGASPEASSPLRTILERPADLKRSIISTPEPDLDLLPSGPGIHGTLSTPPAPSRVQELRRGIHSIDPPYDYVILDCPPSSGPLSIFALLLADSVLIPVQCEYYAMEGLSQMLPLIEEVQDRRGSPLAIAGLLLTMFSGELDLSREVESEVRSFFPDLTLRTVIPRDVALAEASSHGLPICEYAPRSRGAWAYLNLAKEIIANEQRKEARSWAGLPDSQERPGSDRGRDLVGGSPTDRS